MWLIHSVLHQLISLETCDARKTSTFTLPLTCSEDNSKVETEFTCVDASTKFATFILVQAINCMNIWNGFCVKHRLTLWLMLLHCVKDEFTCIQTGMKCSNLHFCTDYLLHEYLRSEIQVDTLQSLCETQIGIRLMRLSTELCNTIVSFICKWAKCGGILIRNSIFLFYTDL
jgi:hypothetical protein